MIDIQLDKILILDFGSQYTQLIARRIREIGVLSEIVSCEISPKELLKFSHVYFGHHEGLVPSTPKKVKRH